MSALAGVSVVLLTSSLLAQPAQPAPAPPAAPAAPAPARDQAAPPAAEAPAAPATAAPAAPAEVAPAAHPPPVAPPAAARAPVPVVVSPATVDDEPPIVDVPEKPTGFIDRLVLETGRAPVPKAESGLMRAFVHGEYQMRFVQQSDPQLAEPGGGPTSLGQKRYLYHWFRITPRFQVSDWLEVIGQIDVPRGLIVGDVTHGVETAEDPLDAQKGFRVEPRWLYAEARTKYGLWRVGQQPSHWGMGIVANDGDHPSLFGDYRRGSIAERVLFATRPAGEKTPLLVAVAGDLVFRDEQAKLTDGDHAWQGVAMVAYDSEPNQIGIYGVYRHQTHDREATDYLTPFPEKLDVFVVDVAGKFAAQVPGAHAQAFGSFEAAMIRGKTDFVRTLDESRAGDKEQIRSYGAAAQLGAVHEQGTGKDRWGDFVGAIEWGWASGDADPNDGTTKRFTFNPNHNVGLLMFNPLLGWKSARAATAASDPSIVARPQPGLQWLPSNGGIFGATYVNPTIVVRPHRRFDAKLGAVIGQSTADVVDPYRLNALGRVQNWDGGDPKRHDLGIELDAGFEWRAGLDYGITLQLGAQAGWLVPGHAFDDAAGNSMAQQYVAVGRVGLQY